MEPDPLSAAVEGLRAHVLRCRAMATALGDHDSAVALLRLAEIGAADADRLARHVCRVVAGSATARVEAVEFTMLTGRPMATVARAGGQSATQ